MIEVKEAVGVAFRLFGELYDGKKFRDILLEEVELADDKTAWRVTISFSRQVPSANIMESIGSKRYVRAFKCFRIDAVDGQMLSMKNRRTEAEEET